MGRRKPSPGPPKSPKPRPNSGRFSPVPSNKVPGNKTPQKTPLHSNRPPTPSNKSSKVRMSPLPGRKTPSSVRSASPSMARKNQASKKLDTKAEKKQPKDEKSTKIEKPP